MAGVMAAAERMRIPSAKHVSRRRCAELRRAALVLPAMLSLALVGCNEPAGAPSTSALAACSRDDVQEVVGKETRSKMLKAALPRLLTAAMTGLVDIAQVENELSQANVSFYNVALDDPATQSGPPFNRIVCGARLQLDMSDAVSGQQIIGVERLRWVINFSEPVDDPASGMFTVDVDAMSIQRGLTVNGHPVAPAEPAEQQAEPGNDGGRSDAAQADINDAVEDAANAARAAADQASRDAAKAVADANAAVDAESSLDAKGRDISTDKRRQKAGQPPSDEDL